MADTRLLKFLRNKEELNHEGSSRVKQCPHCGHFISEEAMGDLEYQVDGVLDCPKCGEGIED